MRITLNEDEIAYIAGKSGTIALAKTRGDFFYLETQLQEIILFTDDDDLIVASSFGTGEEIRRGLACTIFQLRELKAPLIVLPKGHPASSRLKTVVSIGPLTRLSCDIQPGTHPEQDVLCGCEEFSGVRVMAAPGGAEIAGLSSSANEITIKKL
ncbi:MAG TPA: hypothetical protein PKK11_03865 [Methanothrix sp.]|nr:hypothetical protein [Methanothrix sp.]HPT19990.1 hypothetical protein [Methanothrix sp.]